MFKIMLPLVLTAAATASAHQAVTINFAAVVGDAPLACGKDYPDVGSGDTTITLQDARLYVSNLRLLTVTGEEVPVDLEQTPWQVENVALLDFENGTGGCSDVGTAEMNTQVVGEVEEGDYTGLAFDLDVPFALNHLDASTAPSPLNVSSLFWSWQGGYKFARIELLNQQKAAAADMTMAKGEQAKTQTAGHGGMDMSEGHGDMATPANFWPIHLGSTGCASPAPVVGPTEPCDRPNLSTIRLETFNPAGDTVTLDVAGLLEGVDVGRSLELAPPGCMSGFDDPDCAKLFGNFGLSLATGQPAPSQTLFRVTGGGARAAR